MQRILHLRFRVDEECNCGDELASRLLWMEFPFQRSVNGRRWTAIRDIKGRGGERRYSLMSREKYLELFGLTPEEIFTPEELQRIQEIANDPESDFQSYSQKGVRKYKCG